MPSVHYISVFANFTSYSYPTQNSKYDIFSTSISHSGAARAQRATLWGDGIIKYCSALTLSDDHSKVKWWSPKVIITQRWSDDHSKVKKKMDVSRVLLDKDFGFGHHLAHYQVICNISCPLTDDLQHVQNSFHWLETKRQYKVGLALPRTHHSCCRVWWGWSTSSGTRSSQVGSAWTSNATRTWCLSKKNTSRTKNLALNNTCIRCWYVWDRGRRNP